MKGACTVIFFWTWKECTPKDILKGEKTNMVNYKSHQTSKNNVLHNMTTNPTLSDRSCMMITRLYRKEGLRWIKKIKIVD
jgi:hypothetical protein